MGPSTALNAHWISSSGCTEHLLASPHVHVANGNANFGLDKPDLESLGNRFANQLVLNRQVHAQGLAGEEGKEGFAQTTMFLA